jgi:hypothetical protein
MGRCMLGYGHFYGFHCILNVGHLYIARIALIMGVSYLSASSICDFTCVFHFVGAFFFFLPLCM